MAMTLNTQIGQCGPTHTVTAKWDARINFFILFLYFIPDYLYSQSDYSCNLYSLNAKTVEEL